VVIALFAGTHDAPFDRLVRVAELLSERVSAEVLLQYGPSRAPLVPVIGTPALSPDEVRAWLSRALVVVTHGGPGLIFEALAAGHQPIVLPRDPRFGEHVDAHQLAFAARMGGRVRLVDSVEQAVFAAVRGSQQVPPRTPHSAPLAGDVRARVAAALGG